MSRLKYLEKLDLDLNTEKITKASIEHIESMRNLRQVKITESNATKALTNPIFKKNEYLDIYKPRDNYYHDCYVHPNDYKPKNIDI